MPKLRRLDIIQMNLVSCPPAETVPLRMRECELFCPVGQDKVLLCRTKSCETGFCLLEGKMAMQILGCCISLGVRISGSVTGPT